MHTPPQTGTVTPTQTVCSPQRFSESPGASAAHSPEHPPLGAALDKAPAEPHFAHLNPSPEQPLNRLEPLDWMKLLYQGSAIPEVGSNFA
ncbi:hypothetical protein [Deinococcus humi]|uniref:Uncharacterized protein n=1 Tax=Deinococcus humi TaxID=662880 RepID=A0A7W8K1A2_9DEIO|nr:hypothetical protein [Deinococcus humi]MBB5365748.1 hypothetical protein [Deinococcus humi]GGO38362.1 hypothetical protein GCM10008949_44760 [Deinococcus humi]